GQMLALSPPAVKEELLKEAERRDAENALGTASANNVDLEDFLQQGLMEAQSLLVLDLDRCTRCDLCVQACATAHDGVTRLIREGLRYAHYLVATSCRQCRDPLCMVGCPVGSIRRRNELEIHIEDWCIGCGVCADNCPYGNITMHEFEVKIDDPEQPGRRKAVMREKATACDLCKNLAPDQDPSCVVACPHGAAVRGEHPREFFATGLGPTREHGSDGRATAPLDRRRGAARGSGHRRLCRVPAWRRARADRVEPARAVVRHRRRRAHALRGRAQPPQARA